MNQDSNFLRGSRPLMAVDHIIMVESRPKVWQAFRAGLTAETMATVEGRLLCLQHEGRIVSWFITAARQSTFPELLVWVKALASDPQQAELLNVEQDTLFAGGAA